MLEKKVTGIESITVTEENAIIWRERVAIIEDGEEISHSYVHRQLSQGDDTTDAPDQIKKIISGDLWDAQ